MLQRFVSSDGSLLLTEDLTATREIDGLPGPMRLHETPDGKIAASGKMFVLRRFASKGFSEALSLEYAGLSVEAAIKSLAELCAGDRLLLVVMGTSVPGVRRLWCGFRSLWVLEPADLVDRPAIRRLVEDPPDSQYMFLIPVSAWSRLKRSVGPLSCRNAFGKALSEFSHCVVEGGDFLCRDGFRERLLGVLPRAPPEGNL